MAFFTLDLIRFYLLSFGLKKSWKFVWKALNHWPTWKIRRCCHGVCCRKMEIIQFTVSIRKELPKHYKYLQIFMKNHENRSAHGPSTTETQMELFRSPAWDVRRPGSQVTFHSGMSAEQCHFWGAWDALKNPRWFFLTFGRLCPPHKKSWWPWGRGGLNLLFFENISPPKIPHGRCRWNHHSFMIQINTLPFNKLPYFTAISMWGILWSPPFSEKAPSHDQGLPGTTRQTAAWRHFGGENHWDPPIYGGLLAPMYPDVSRRSEEKGIIQGFSPVQDMATIGERQNIWRVHPFVQSKRDSLRGSRILSHFSSPGAKNTCETSSRGQNAKGLSRVLGTWSGRRFESSNL